MNNLTTATAKKRRICYLVKLTIIDSLIVLIVLFFLAIITNNMLENYITDDTKTTETSSINNNSFLTAGVSTELSDIINNNSLQVSLVKINLVKQSLEVEEATENLESQYDTYAERHIYVDYSNNDEIYEEYIYPLAKIIYAEGGNMSDEFQQFVGYVVCNRVNSKYYPNTIESVFFSGDAYAEASKERFLNEEVSEQAINNAKIVVNDYLNDTIPVCPAMVFQAEFEQGVDISQIGNTFFGCDSRIHEDLEKE